MRVPPHSAEAEKGVLGSILLDASRVMDLCVGEGVVSESFYFDAHRRLFDEFVAMQRTGMAIDLLTAVERLRSVGRLDALGGTAFLEGLVDATPTAAHAEYYIDIVRQKHLLRAVIDCARETERTCFESNQSADLILGQTEQAFLNITERQHGQLFSWVQVINSTMQHVERLFQLGPGGVAGIPAGLRNLDKKLRGFRPGELTVLAARPSMGKTSLAMNIAECMALGRDMEGQRFKGDHARQHPVAIFSLEMAQEALALRMLCGMAGVPAFQIDSGLGNPQKVTQQLTRAASELGKAPIYVDDTGGLDVMELRARARRLKKKYHIEMIIVDYLQLMNCRDMARQGRQLETAAVSSNLKAMAKELKLPVIVLSQLSRAPEQRGDKSARPKLSDLRDSGAIEQDADVVLLLRRPCRNPGDPEFEDKTLAIVDVAKHRNGPTGEVRLNFHDSLTRFNDRADVGPGDGDYVAGDDAEAAGVGEA
ncbi:MAG: replicative DNA helicase, partial [Kiritimatiellia bacterium]